MSTATIYTDRRDFASECDRLRNERGVSVAKLGLMLGRPRTTVGYYLSWRTRIPDREAQLLADFFGLQVRLPLEH